MHTTTHRTARRTARTPSATISRHIEAPVDTVWALLADPHRWPSWGPFTQAGAPMHLDQPGLPHHLRLGRRDLSVAVSSPDAPYRLRYRLTSARAARHVAEVTLSPTDEGTELRWQATLPPALPLLRRRRAALTATVTELAARLASAAEDPPTTRADWDEQRSTAELTGPAHTRHPQAA